MKSPSLNTVFGISTISFVVATIALGFVVFGKPGSHLVPEPVPVVDELAVPVLPPMPSTMDNPSVEDLLKLAQSAGSVEHFSYYKDKSSLPVSIIVDYEGNGFTHISLDGLNNSHLYFQLSEALKAAGKLKQ